MVLSIEYHFVDFHLMTTDVLSSASSYHSKNSFPQNRRSFDIKGTIPTFFHLPVI